MPYQEFAIGREWGGAALMAVENAPKGKKAFYSSGVKIGFGVGLILSTGAILLIIHVLGEAAFSECAWCIPFLISIFHLYENVYLVTNFTRSYSTHNLGIDKQFFLNITLLVGTVSRFSIPLFIWIANHFDYRKMCILSGIIGPAGAFPFFMALNAQNIGMIILFAILLANVAHDMVVSVQQPIFTSLFGTKYRYSDAGVCYQVASIIGSGFTPFIAASLVILANGSWHYVAIYLAIGCLLTRIITAFMPLHQD